MRSLAVAFAVFTTAVAPVTAFAAPTSSTQEAYEQEALKDCARNQISMNLCSYHKYKVADAELNELYQRQISRLKGTSHEERLRAAQRAWLRYVEADCLYQNGPAEGSGTMRPFAQNRCFTAHTKQRIELLKEFLSCTSNGCPGE